MSHPRPPAVVYTDLDGTLLDHHDYRWDAAVPALRALAASGIPVVPITSKTLAEMLPLRRDLGLITPFAVENGSVLCVPAGYFGADLGECIRPGLYVQRLGPAHADVLACLAALRRESGARFTGFSDMSEAEIARRTGLSPTAAAAARQRLCSEPLVWDGDDAELKRFLQELTASGLAVRRGGRFLHVLGSTDKGVALRRLHRRFAAGRRVPSLALGDSDNDLDMLAAADRSVLVARPDGGYAAPARPPHLTHAPGAGPAGWRRAVLDWLEDVVQFGDANG